MYFLSNIAWPFLEAAALRRVFHICWRRLFWDPDHVLCVFFFFFSLSHFCIIAHSCAITSITHRGHALTFTFYLVFFLFYTFTTMPRLPKPQLFEYVHIFHLQLLSVENLEVSGLVWSSNRDLVWLPADTSCSRQKAQTQLPPLSGVAQLGWHPWT